MTDIEYTIEYKVQISRFEGPLDLLLHLIGKARIDIEEIFVSEVTGQYLSYVSQMDGLSMDSASEFIEMAALLVYIKSRMILPTGEMEDDGEEDPEQELILRLKTYKVYKEASLALKEYEHGARDVCYKLPDEFDFPDEKVDLAEITMQQLLDAYAQVLARVPDTQPEHIEQVEIHHDIFTIKDRTRHIIHALTSVGSATFFSLFSDARSKMEVAVTFIALLELIHENKVSITQSDCYDDIYITKTKREAAS